MKQYFKKGNVTSKDVTALEELRDLDLSHGTLGARGLFFPLFSPLNFRRTQQEKNPLAPRVKSWQINLQKSRKAGIRVTSHVTSGN